MMSKAATSKPLWAESSSAASICRTAILNPGPKFEYKLDWFRRLTDYAAELFELEVPVILAGDFNVMPTERIYTFFDYFRNAYQRNAGLRIDHFLLTPDVAKGLNKAEVAMDVRGWEHTSDHAPVWIEVDLDRIGE